MRWMGFFVVFCWRWASPLSPPASAVQAPCSCTQTFTSGFPILKGTWSWDEWDFLLTYCRLVVLGKNEGHGRLNFSDALQEKKCTPLYQVSAYIGSKFYCFSLVRVQGSRPLLPTGWRKLQILRWYIWSFVNSTQLGISRQQQKAIKFYHWVITYCIYSACDSVFFAK
jgi:hypothetical protein